MGAISSEPEARFLIASLDAIDAADECDVRVAFLRDLVAEVDRLRGEARRYYHGDGSWETLPTAEAAVARRIAAAKEMERMGLEW
jgi:hypothetical protein